MNIQSGVVSGSVLVERRRAAGTGGHGFVLGCPGSGKTLILKEQIRSILENSEDTVVVLDTNGSFGAFAEALGGQVVPVEVDAGVYLNPLDVDAACMGPDGDFLEDKADFVRSLLEEFLGRELTAKQSEMIGRCMKKVYAPFCGSVDVVSGEYDKELLPTLTDLHELLCSLDDADARLMAEILWPFVNGCYKDFGRKSNVRYDNRLVVYDLFNVRGPFLGAAMMVVLELARNHKVSAVQENGDFKNNLWVVVDDACLFLRSESSVEFLLRFCKSADYYGCIFTGVTQYAAGFFDWDAGKELLETADYLHVMRLLSVDKRKLAEFFDLDEESLSDGVVCWNA